MTKKIKVYNRYLDGIYIIYSRNVLDEEDLEQLRKFCHETFDKDNAWVAVPSELVKKIKFIKTRKRRRNPMLDLLPFEVS